MLNRFVIFLLIILMLFSCTPLSLAYADNRLDRCLPYKEYIVSLLLSEDISADYFYLAVCESSCRNVVSPKGAHGFFQVTHSIYKYYKPDDCTLADIDDIKCNTIAAARYIKHLQKRFKKMSVLIKAYNRGGTNLIKKGSTKEADGLSHCVMKYVSNDNL